MINEAALNILADTPRSDYPEILRDLTQHWLGHPPPNMEPAARALAQVRYSFAEAAYVASGDTTARSVRDIVPQHVQMAMSSGDFGASVIAGMNDNLQTVMHNALGPIQPLLHPLNMTSYQPMGQPQTDIEDLPEVKEGGEIPDVSTSYSGWTVALKKHAANLLHTRESLLVGLGFDLLATELLAAGQAGARTTVAMLAAALADTAPLPDGGNWFGAAYNNDLAAAALDVAALGAATAALMNYPLPGGGLAGVRAQKVIVSPDDEMAMRAIVASLSSTDDRLQVVPVPGLVAGTFFVTGGEDNRAITQAQLEGGAMSIERINARRASKTVDAEAFRVRLETNIVPRNRLIIRTVVA